MTEIAYALYAIGIVLLVGVAVVYVRRNPKLSAELKTEFDKLHTAAATMMDQLHMIHTVASAPVSVTLIPTAAPPAAPSPVQAAAPAADSSNPFVAWRAAGLDIWTVMTGPYLNRSLTEADWVQALAAGYTRPEALQPRPVPDANVDPYIFGDRFDFSRPGVYLRTKGGATRTLPIPADFKGFVRLEVVPNSDTVIAGPVIYAVNGVSNVFPENSFGTGPFAVLAVGVPAAPNEITCSPGDVTIGITVACDLLFRVMPA